MRLIFLGLLCVTTVYAGNTVTLTMDLRDYGLPEPDDNSCPSTGTGWFVDRAYGASCFGRQVNCINGAYQNSFYTCPNNQVYTTDGDFSCYAPSAVPAACEVNVICNQDAIGIIVDHDAIWDQVDADLQIGSYKCPISYDGANDYYMTTKSILNSSWSDCGISRSLMQDPTGGDGYSIMYSFQVKRYTFRNALEINGTSDRVEEQHGGVTVTREKCFMVDAYCYYNADGTVTSNFVPSSANTLTQSDTSTLEFDLYPVSCANPSGGQIDPQVVYVGDEVCFGAEITTNWHDSIRMQIQNCWATNSNGDIYPLAHRNASHEDAVDNTWDWDCYDGTSNLYIEYFSFDAFRFQNFTFAAMNNPASYVQTIPITCEVVACESDDFSSSDCRSTCTVARQRRAASDSVLGHYTHDFVHSQAYVLERKQNYFNTDSFKFNNTFSLLMFGTGCVLAVAVIGLLITLNRMKKEVKYGILPQDVRKA